MKATAMCNFCKQFLSDFLEAGIQKELPLSKYLRMSSLYGILPEVTEWVYRFYQRLPIYEFEKAFSTSAKIARRGRKLIDYEYLLHTATFNFLKVQIYWIPSEVDYLKTLLIESGFARTRHMKGAAYDYISYTVPRALLLLQDLHEDHRVPKGLYTDLGKLYRKPHHDMDDTCADTDDYMSEILNEDSDDLYT